MRAMQISEFGGPEVFQQVEVPDPAAGDGEVVIGVRASSVNPVDYKIRDGRAARLWPALPAILHADCAGVVESVGAGVTDFSVGDEVYSFATGLGGKPGALAERMAADARMVAPKPASLSFEEAAALPLVTMTVWYCLVDMIDIRPGDTVLVQGGTGGVGHVAVQIAKWRGGHVYATCGSAEKCEIAESLGARKAYDYSGTTPQDWVEDATDGAGFDVVFNTPGAASIDASVLATRDFGTILDILGDFPVERGFQAKWLTFKSVFAGRPIVSGDNPEQVGAVLRTASELVAEGKLRPLLDDRRFTFDTVADAHRAAEGSPTGKVVLTNSWS